jgi:ADP-heptose:LPS heptosyltransferase
MNILIVKPGAIGDLLQMTPVFRALKKQYGDCRITLMVGSVVTASMFRHHRSIDEVLVFDRKGEHRSPGAFLKLRREIRSRKFDLVLNFQRSNLKAWLLVSAAFPCRVLVYHKARTRIVHAVVNHLETLAPLGIAPDDTYLECYPGPEEESFAERLFVAEGLADRTVVALNPGASHPVNRWEPRCFAALADLVSQRLGAGIVLVGGKEDQGLAGEVAAQAQCRPLVLTGTTDLLQLAAVLRRCSVLVSGDTGPMHMATAVGTGVVALFGAADPDRTGPVGTGHRIVRAARVPCVPCRSRSCTHDRHPECMKQITPEQVYAEIAAMIGTKGDRT